MKKKKLTNRELDEFGKRLVVACGVNDGEIDHIVSNPQLFKGVAAKVAPLQTLNRTIHRQFAWKPLTAAAVFLMLVSAGLFGYIRFAGTGEKASIGQRVPPAVYKVDEKPFDPIVIPPQPAAEKPKAIPAVMTKSAEIVPPAKIRRTQRPVTREPEPVFHAIGFTEKAEDAAIDGRVVRVEMPRSALFALGVNVPLENGTRSVKADLLVGADGAPRAIRLVE